MPWEGTKKCGKVASPFYSSATRNFFVKELLLPLHLPSLFSQSNRRKNLAKGGADLVLSLPPLPADGPPMLFPYDLTLPPPTTTPPQHPPPPHPAAPSAHIEQSLTAVTWEGYKPACRYCSYFQIPIVSCRWCPYVLPLCISRQKDFVLVLLVLFLPFSFPFTFGLSSKVRAKDTCRWKEAPYFACLICCIYIDEMKPLL